jgi:flagellar hook assembly protein FlgD
MPESDTQAEIGNSYPNPFTTETSIPLEIRMRGHVTLEILDVRGTKIKTLASQVFEPGSKTIIWNGTDENGNKVPPGVYQYRFTGEKTVVTKKMVLIR